MEPTGRIVVMRPDAIATAAVIDGETSPHDKTGTEIITGHDVFLFVARGEGSYQANGRTSVLRPNTLISAPAGTLACSLSEDRELYVVAVRDPVEAPDDPSAFSPFLEQHFSPSEGNRWRHRMMEYADRAASGRFGFDDVRRLKNAVLPYVWKREPHAAQGTLQSLFASIWTRLAQPLTLDGLARDVGYTANYLNDLTREHTGRALGSWIADMRMARARAALELTDLPVADIGVSCGYDDPAYFSRAFRRAHGVPPATWRIGTRPYDSRYAGVTIPMEVLHELETSRALPQRAYSFAS
jgi:AraC-like DNA-binding protein/mannose-6-phosphate isomerase-like protein (cupin superfamily)